MPQPISNLGKNITYQIGYSVDIPVLEKPQHCQAAIYLIGKYALLESYVASVFIELLGANASTSSAVFSSIRSQAWQQLAINAAAAEVFSDDQEMQDIVAAVLKICEAAGKLRHRLAHWIWGHSPELPDAILLADPVAIAAHEARQKSSDVWLTSPTATEDSEIDRRKIFAYTLEDLNDGIAQVHVAVGFVVRLKGCIASYSEVPKEPAMKLLGDVSRRRLKAEPEIHQLLEQIERKRQRQNAPQGQTPAE